MKEVLTSENIRRILPEEMIRWDVRYFTTLDSTQKKAAEIFRSSGKGGVLVITDAQTAGRGREGNRWMAPRGEALLLSMILLPPRSSDHLPLLTITTALAVCDALRRFLNLQPEMKWPNDVLLYGKKICGVLTETVHSKNGASGLVTGVGINVNQGASAFTGELEETASSVKIALGQETSRLGLLGAVMRSFEDHYFLFQKGDHEEIIRRWKNHSAMLGRSVSLNNGMREVRGTVIDLEDSGAIVLRLETGTQESFFGSQCRFLP